MITACKRFLGMLINNFMSESFVTFSYKCIDDVVNMLTPEVFMARVDIE